MGMPVIIPGGGTREQAITNLMESVAMQETALSHILNAEGEKIQAIMALPDVTPEQLITLDKSAELLVDSITKLEMILQAKLDLFAPEIGGANE